MLNQDGRWIREGLAQVEALTVCAHIERIAQHQREIVCAPPDGPEECVWRSELRRIGQANVDGHEMPVGRGEVELAAIAAPARGASSASRDSHRRPGATKRSRARCDTGRRATAATERRWSSGVSTSRVTSNDRHSGNVTQWQARPVSVEWSRASWRVRHLFDRISDIDRSGRHSERNLELAPL